MTSKAFIVGNIYHVPPIGIEAFAMATDTRDVRMAAVEFQNAARGDYMLKMTPELKFSFPRASTSAHIRAFSIGRGKAVLFADELCDRKARPVPPPRWEADDEPRNLGAGTSDIC